MTEPGRVGDLLRTRRDLLRLGGLGLLGASIDGVWPLQVSAKQSDARVQPRATARNVLFYEMSGAISHVDSYDFKESAGTPQGPRDDAVGAGPAYVAAPAAEDVEAHGQNCRCAIDEEP